MDDPAVLLRMMERIVAVVIGGVSIYFGYRLFLELPIQEKQSGELELPGMKIVLSRVGPGVFFAAFGTAILVYSLTSEVTLRRSPAIAAAATETGATDVATPAVGGVEIYEEFIGATGQGQTLQIASMTDAAGAPQRRARALASIELLNCNALLMERYESDVELLLQQQIAVRDAKGALLQSIWDSDAWGPPSSLGVMGPAADAPQALHDAYDAVYANCPP